MRDNFIVKPGGLLLLGASALIWSSSVLAVDYERGGEGTATLGQEQRGQDQRGQLGQQHDQQRGQFGQQDQQRGQFGQQHDQQRGQLGQQDQQRGQMGQQYDQQRGQFGQQDQVGDQQRRTGIGDERAGFGEQRDQFARGEKKGEKLSSNQVRDLQQELSNEGYQVAVDGIWGPETQQALREYQMDENLEVSGQPDQQTLASLGVDTGAMGRFGEQDQQRGMEQQRGQQVQLSSSQIRNLQQELNQEGHDISVDGIWGPETQRALTEYQRDENLPVTGRPDQQTLASLGIEDRDTPRAGLGVEDRERDVHRDDHRDSPRAGLGLDGLQRDEIGDREGRFGDVPGQQQRGAEQRGQFGAAERGQTTGMGQQQGQDQYGMGEQDRFGGSGTR